MVHRRISAQSIVKYAQIE